MEQEAALARLFDHFVGSAPLSDAEYVGLSDAVAEYAQAHPAPVVEIDAVDMMDFVIDQSGLTPKAFAAKHQLSFDVKAFLRREKRMTIAIARELSDRFHWPAEVLLRPYKLNAPKKPAAKPRALNRRAATPSP